MNKLIQLLTIFAILFTALFGLGFGLCGFWGLSMAVLGPASQANATILALSALGIIVAVLAGALIYFVLWKSLRRRSRKDEYDQS